jgi:hypothetical protein
LRYSRLRSAPPDDAVSALDDNEERPRVAENNWQMSVTRHDVVAR